jgi:hypothetical protein
VLSEREAPAMRTFIAFAAENELRLAEIARSGDVGTDQTPLNLLFRRESQRVTFMPQSFNCLHCFPMSPYLHRLERDPMPNWERFASVAFSRPHAFGFLERGYVWHFSNVVEGRTAVMRETWRRIAAHYPGAAVEEPKEAASDGLRPVQ